MAEQEQDRSEAATPYKLKEAQQRGQVSKSQEATFAAILAAFVLVLYSVGGSISGKELRLMMQVFDHAARMDWTADAMCTWLSNVLTAAMVLLMPMFLAIFGAAIIANMAQVGAVFSFKPITPDFERINPASGLKRLFSITLIYNAGKSLFKLFALTWVLWIVLANDFSHLFTLSQINVRAHADLVMGKIPPMLFKMLMVILILAMLDVGYTRWDFSKKMRMSRREVRDEGKQREGDPRIRSRMRQLRAEMLKQSRAMRNIPDADVLITNPTHLAIAISYKHGAMPAPKVLTKGAGGVAKKMREVARLNHIPIVENPLLARAMYKRVKAGEYLPADLYPMTAKILLWVYSLRKARATANSRSSV